ncbi:hypothetical protein Ndes2526B_g05965 [Nannochloris sp. 'desiccata']
MSGKLGYKGVALSVNFGEASAGEDEAVGGEVRSSEDKARRCFNLWNKALATKKASVVTARYKYGNKYGVLLPTLSNKVRRTKEGLEDYFKSFLKNSPQGKITELYASQKAGYTFASGLYDFTLTTDGKQSLVPARFSYVFNKNCKIIQHHSSQMPEGN